METHVKSEVLEPEKGIELEMKTYSDNKIFGNKPRIVYAKGFRESARKDGLVEILLDDFDVTAMSPRNAGDSNGHYTIGNYIADFRELIGKVTQEDGEKPYGIGHSTGGYVLAQLLGENPSVKRAALIAPLLNMTEQMPNH